MKENILLALCLSLSPTLSEAAVTCTSSATRISFGTINPLSSTAITSVGEVYVNCAGGPASYTISLSQGNGSVMSRVMRNGPHSLHYNLYTSNSYSNIIGDGNAGSMVIKGSSTADDTNSSHLIYGKISNIGLSSTEPGVYIDSVAVMIVY